MAIPPQRFRARHRGLNDYGRSITVETGEQFHVSFSQLRGEPFGDGVRTWTIIDDSGSVYDTLQVPESRGQSPDAGSANSNVTIDEPGDYEIKDEQSSRRVSVTVNGIPVGTGGVDANQDFSNPVDRTGIDPTVDDVTSTSSTSSTSTVTIVAAVAAAAVIGWYLL